jgi:hypothetical protein
LLASQLPLAALMIFNAPAFIGILVIDSDIAVASVIFAVASFHLLHGFPGVDSVLAFADILAASGVPSLLLLAFLLRLSGTFAIDVSVHDVG